MTRNQIRFLIAAIIACAIRLAAQEAGEAVGWDPQSCWDCTPFGLTEMYGFMLSTPTLGVIIGAARIVDTQSHTSDLVMLKLR